MTADDVCIAALARTAEFNATTPSTRSVMYHRINAKQQQLFSYVADRDPEIFGKSADCALTAGAFDLSTLTPKYERITFVEILDIGTSAYVSGDEVNVVPIFDRDAALAPRATIRDAILAQVSTDLALVSSVRVHYSKRADEVNDGADTIQFLEQFQELLVLDLTEHLITKALDLETKRKEEILELIGEETAEMMKDLDRHCEHQRFAETARHGHSQQAEARPVR